MNGINNGVKIMEQFDFVAIGCGPYNLGLMALSESTRINGICFEQRDTFVWHEGMLIEPMTMQTHYLYDLVTLADPTNRHSYLNYLKRAGRLQTFIVQENPRIPRTEFNRYLSSVASEMENIHFSSRVIDVKPIEKGFHVTVEKGGESKTFYTRHVVIGTGAEPLVPETFENVVHTSTYRMNKERLLEHDQIVVIGSGQSAAEVYLDLLKQTDRKRQIDWVTRADVFESLETGKLGTEIFSMAYIDYFNGLSYGERKQLNHSFERFRNGINPETLHDIYGTLYHRTADGTEQPTNLHIQIEIDRVKRIGGKFAVEGKAQHTNQVFQKEYDAVIAATGYRPLVPKWINQYNVVWEEEGKWRVNKRYEIEVKQKLDGKLFTHTNLEHSHGPAATNLGMAVYRNAMILNTIAEETIYMVEEQKPFTAF